MLDSDILRDAVEVEFLLLRQKRGRNLCGMQISPDSHHEWENMQLSVGDTKESEFNARRFYFSRKSPSRFTGANVTN